MAAIAIPSIQVGFSILSAAALALYPQKGIAIPSIQVGFSIRLAVQP